MDSVRILIAEDHEVMRRGLRSLLCARPGWELCGEAADGREAVEKAKQLKPDVIVLDISLPVMNGLDAARIIHDEVPQTQILILSQYDPAEMKSKALEAGARGYVSKSAVARELLQALEAVVRHRQRSEPAAETKTPIAPDQLEERVKERTAELERMQASLCALTGRLLQVQDDERRQIARELHDSSGQALAAMSINLSMIEMETEKLSPEASKAVTQCLQLVREISKELRTISYLLHPPLLDEAGLPSAIRWYLEGFAERSGIHVELDLVPPDLARLPRDHETAVFRVVQECLNNIHRHSGSPTAAIRVTLDARVLRLEVRDFGKGMPEANATGAPGAVKTGVGIQGMRERMRQLGGRLEIQSASTGTTVTAILPVSGAAISSADQRAGVL